MKKQLITILIALLSVIYVNAQSGAAVNATGAAADPSAMLDVSSSDKGVLIPRMTEAERTAIAVPARGLMVYQIDNSEGFWYFDGSAWTQFGDNLGNHIASDSLDMANKKIINLATCTQNNDAANKEYVDNAVSAGGGGGSSLPSMLSSESVTAYTLSEAVDYCTNLNEGGFTDWRLPLFNELSLFFGSDITATNFLWTRSMANGDENPIIQHYISARISDGKFRNAKGQSLPLLGNSVSGLANNATTFKSLGIIAPIDPNNWLSITHVMLEGYRSSSGGGTIYLRLKFNFANGSTAYSTTYTSTASAYTAIFEWSNIQQPVLLTSLELEGYYNSTYVGYGRLTVSGNEVSPDQKDGNTLKARCIR